MLQDHADIIAGVSLARFGVPEWRSAGFEQRLCVTAPLQRFTPLDPAFEFGARKGDRGSTCSAYSLECAIAIAR